MAVWILWNIESLELTINNSMSLLTITDTARSHFRKMLQREGARTLTLSMKASGCNGFSYHYDYDAPIEIGAVEIGAVRIPINHVAVEDDEQLYELYIIAKSIPFLMGTTIDYVRDGLSYKLVYDNPTAKGSCGCGESVNF